jgi:GPI mannosyltransferase 2
MAPTIAGRSKSSTSNVRRLFVYLLGYRVLCGVILLACSYLPPFDSSHQIVWPASTTTASILERFISTTLRWDSFHFLEIAQKGYTYEHLYAFFPGTPTVMRISSLPFGYSTISGLLWGSWVTVASCFTLTTLYELTVAYTGSQELAMLSTACSILTTSPATLLHAPYAEPFFAFFSFKGALIFLLGARGCLTFRRNAVLLSW